MRKIFALGTSSLPLLFGLFIDYQMTHKVLFGFKLTLICLTFAAFWFICGMMLNMFKLKKHELIIGGNTVSIIFFIYIMVQLLFLDGLSNNHFGALAEVNFLPMVSVVRFIDIFNIVNSSPMTFVFSFIMYIFTFGLGVHLGSESRRVDEMRGIYER